MSKKLDDARNRLAETYGRLQQANETRSAPEDHGYYIREATLRLAEAVEAILDGLEEAEEEVDDDALLE